MEKDSIKWLIAGLAGALLTVALFAGSGIAIFMYLKDHAPEDRVSWFDEESDDDEVILSGPDQWAEKESNYNESKAVADAYAKARGLDTLYETVPFLDDTREVLYKEQNFDLVNERLATHLASATTPFEKYRYQVLISDLGEINYNYDPEALLTTLNAWVAHSPDSYLPLLIRGSFYVDYGWYYRGESLASNVTPEGWEKYKAFHDLAWDDLTKAAAMNSTDPEIPATLMRAAAGRSSDGGHGNKLEALRMYYEQALALNPHHMGVRFTMLNYAQPKWFGSWSAMDDVLREMERAKAEFPLLGIVNARAMGMMYSRSRAHRRNWDSGESDRFMAKAYRAQAEQNPDELMLLSNAAHFALESHDRTSALEFFRKIGNRFARGTEYNSIWNYHWWRVNTLVERSAEVGVIGTPEEKALLDEALALDPSNPSISCMYLAYLERTRDDAQTTAFLESAQDPYLQTHLLEEPLNYDLIKGVALAGRSDEYGYQGTDDEPKMLEEALALAPDNAFVRLVYAEYFITADEFDKARSHLEHARSVDPGYLPSLHIMGWLNFHQKRWDDAIACANEFLATSPSLYRQWNAEDAKEIIQLCEEKKTKETDSGA